MQPSQAELLHVAGFVAITVRRDVLDVSFYGLDSAQPSYTAAIEREARVPADSRSHVRRGTHKISMSPGCHSMCLST